MDTPLAPATPGGLIVPPPPAPEVGRAQRRTGIVLGLLLFGVGLVTIRTFLPALAWGAVLAIATWPLYRRVRLRFPPRGHDLLWPGLFTAAVALLFVVPLAIAAIEIARESHVVFELVESARKTGLPVPDFLPKMPLVGASAAAWWSDNLASPDAASELIERMNHDAFASYTRSLGGQLIHRGVIFGFAIVTLFFLYRDGLWLTGELKSVSQRTVGPHGERVGRQAVASVHGTIDGLVLVGLGEGVLIGIAYWFAGVPHPILFAAATAVAAMIPFGAAILFCAAALIVVAQGAVAGAIVIVAVGSVVVFVADHFVRPALIGGATKLPFLWVLLGILGGVETFGLLGLFLGPAVMAVLHLLWRDWAERPAGTPAIIHPADAAADQIQRRTLSA